MKSVKSACIYVAWTKTDKILDVDLAAANSLADNVDELIFVHNLNLLKNSKAERFSAKTNKFLYLPRTNTGYDFGGYRHGINFAINNFLDLEELFIVNNSFYVIQKSIDSLFEKMRNSDANLIGITDSFEIQKHLQSYFIRFDKKILVSKAFETWLNEIPNSNDKDLIVNKMELPLLNYFESAGFRAKAVFEYKELVDFAISNAGVALLGKYRESLGYQHLYRQIRDGVAVNPSHYFWRHLIELGYPFMKKDLFSRFGASGLGLQDWSDYVSNKSLATEISKNIPLKSFRI